MKKLLALVLAGTMLTSIPVFAKDTKEESPTDQTIVGEDPSKNPEVALERKDTLVQGINDFTGVLNPLYSESSEDATTGNLMVDSLAAINKKGEVVDGTGKLTVSEDGKTYTYKLVDQKYNDGSEVKAQDYVNYFKVIDDKSYDGFIDLTNEKIVGWADYHDGKTPDIKGITTPDDKTIVIQLEEPNFLAAYSVGNAWPISTEKYGSLIKQGDVSGFKNLKMENFVGNGQYTLKSVKQKESIILERNKYYYKGEPKIKNVIKKVIAVDSGAEALNTGDVDLVEDITCNEDNIEQLKADGFINMRIQPTLGYGYVALNHANPLFKDQKVRQALLTAIDREGLVKSVYGDYAQVINVPQAKFAWAYDDKGLNKYEYDVDKAAKLLKEAGWVKKGDKLEKDGKQMKIMFTAMKGNPVTDNLIPQLIDSYKKLGISFQAEYVDWPTLQQKVQDKKFDMFFMAWTITANPDLKQTYASADKGGGQNRLNYSNPELDELLSKAAHVSSKDEFKKLYKDVYKIINEDLPAFTIYQRCDLIGYNDRIKGFNSEPYTPWYSDLYKMSLSNK